jgi:hypothetical protein
MAEASFLKHHIGNTLLFIVDSKRGEPGIGYFELRGPLPFKVSCINLLFARKNIMSLLQGYTSRISKETLPGQF